MPVLIGTDTGWPPMWASPDRARCPPGAGPVVSTSAIRVSAITRFDNAVLFRFGFPRTLDRDGQSMP